jgi:hypothetical protein
MDLQNVVELKMRRRPASTTPPGDQAATVIIFPGVRYERRDEAPKPSGTRPVPDRARS